MQFPPPDDVGIDKWHVIIFILGIKVRFRSEKVELKRKLQNIETALANQKKEIKAIQRSAKDNEEGGLVIGRCLFNLWKKLYGFDADTLNNNWLRQGSGGIWIVRHISAVLSHYESNSHEAYSENFGNRVICFYDDVTARTGLCDRLRTFAIAYVMAAESGLNFYIYHDAGFKLSDYLIPNEVDWRVERGDVSININNVVPLFFMRTFRILNKCCKDYHIHQSESYLEDFLTPELKDKYTNHGVFSKLFKFHPNVVKVSCALLESQKLANSNYVSVHARFLNFFEKVENWGKATSTANERVAMIAAVKKTIEKIHNDTKLPIILFSDSNTFLEQFSCEYVHVLPGKVGHVVVHGADAEVAMKTFVDFYVMSKSVAIYCLQGDNLYDSNFSKYAAAVANVPFIREPLIK